VVHGLTAAPGAARVAASRAKIRPVMRRQLLVALFGVLLGGAALAGCSDGGGDEVGEAIPTGNEDETPADDIDASSVDLCANLTRLLLDGEREGEVWEKLAEEIWVAHPEELREPAQTLRQWSQFAEEAEDAENIAQIPSGMVPLMGDMEFAYNDFVYWMSGNCDLATPPWACLEHAPAADPIVAAEGGGLPSPEEAAAQLVGPELASTLAEKSRTEDEVVFQVLDTDGLATEEVTVTLAADGTWLPVSRQVCYSPRGNDSWEPTGVDAGE
jgi:hypothetical protein